MFEKSLEPDVGSPWWLDEGEEGRKVKAYAFSLYNWLVCVGHYWTGEYRKVWVGLKSEFTRKFGHDKFDLCLEDFVGHVQQVVEYHSLDFGVTAGLTV